MTRENGYHTGIVGKWHLGLGDKAGVLDWNADFNPGPLEIGFDVTARVCFDETVLFL